MAAPSEYTEERGIEICRRIAEGEPLTKICKSEGMVDVSTVYRWQRAHPEFAELMRVARWDQATTLFDEAIAIADEPVPLDADGRLSNAAVQAQRLRVDTRKWCASKLLPERFGDQVALTGARGEPLVPRREAVDIDMIELARKIAFIMNSAAIEQQKLGRPLALPAPLQRFATTEAAAED